MEAQELRQLNATELNGRIRQWEDELFRLRFKAQSSEARDTSVFHKLRKEIARAYTVLNEKKRLVDSRSEGKVTVVKAEASVKTVPTGDVKPARELTAKIRVKTKPKKEK